MGSQRYTSSLLWQVGAHIHDQAGHSVLAHVNGFYPYFYIAAPRGFRNEDLESFRTYLNVRELSHGRRLENRPSSNMRAPVTIDACQREPSAEYHHHQEADPVGLHGQRPSDVFEDHRQRAEELAACAR